MDFSLMIANDVEKMRIAEAARKAPWVWRFRHLKSKGRKALVAILASTIAFFVQ